MKMISNNSKIASLVKCKFKLLVKKNFMFLLSQRYFVGRKYMFDNDIKGADQYLGYAFQKCDISMKKNKRMILIYLIPGGTF